MQPTRTAGLITGAFALAAILWIVGSDLIASGYAGSNVSMLRELQLFKGGVFVIGTTAALFFVIRWILQRQVHYKLAREEIMQDERREIGRVVARTLVHDVRNIMAILQSNIDYLRMKHDGDDSRAALDDVDEALRDLNSLIDQLRESSTTKTELDRVEFFDAVNLCVRILRTDSRFREVSVDSDFGGEAVILAHPVLLRQALLNIFVNAAEAGATRLSIRGEIDGDNVRLDVCDDGPGMSEEAMRRAFEPFFSTKNRGSGLGLVSVKQTLEFHGGSVELGRAPQGGLRVVLTIPLASAGASQRQIA